MFVPFQSTAFQTVTAYNQAPINAVAGPSTRIARGEHRRRSRRSTLLVAEQQQSPYQVRIGGRTLYLTAIQLEHRFMGAKSAIWGFWKDKTRVSKHKVREFLIHGRRQFLDDDEHSELIVRRKDGTLSGFTFKKC